MQYLLRIFFHQLYHRFAWGYDFVACLVSLGRWNEWCQSIIPLLPAGKILEIGFGPGHLQHSLAITGKMVVGLDESWQMNFQAGKRYPGLKFLRARAERAPFADGSFEVITSTFPAAYIFEPHTATEMYRLLTPNGQIVALLAARPAGSSLADRFVRTLFKITGETPPAGFNYSILLKAYRETGFSVISRWEKHPTAELLIMRGQKQASPDHETSI